MGSRTFLIAGIAAALSVGLGTTDGRLVAAATAMPLQPVGATPGIVLQVQGEENPLMERLQRKKRAAREAEQRKRQERKAEAAEDLRQAERQAQEAEARARAAAIEAEQAAAQARKAEKEAQRAEARALRAEAEEAAEQGIFSVGGAEPEVDEGEPKKARRAKKKGVVPE